MVDSTQTALLFKPEYIHLPWSGRAFSPLSLPGAISQFSWFFPYHTSLRKVFWSPQPCISFPAFNLIHHFVPSWWQLCSSTLYCKNSYGRLISSWIGVHSLLNVSSQLTQRLCRVCYMSGLGARCYENKKQVRCSSAFSIGKLKIIFRTS